MAFRRTGLRSPKLPTKYLKHFEHLRPESEDAEPRRYQPEDFFSGMFAEELSKIPVELHERIAIYVHRHVEAKVKDRMAEFRKEVDA